MWCFIYRSRIADAIDSGIALPERAERHITSCARCRTEWEAGKTIAARLAARDDGDTRLPAGLHGQMMDAVRGIASAAPPVAPAWPIWAPLGSVALCLLLAAGILALLAGSKSTNVTTFQMNGVSQPSPLAQVSGVAPAVVSLASTAGKTVTGPFAPETAALERMASAATRAVLAASLERLPGVN